MKVSYRRLDKKNACWESIQAYAEVFGKVRAYEITEDFLLKYRKEVTTCCDLCFIGDLMWFLHYHGFTQESIDMRKTRNEQRDKLNYRRNKRIALKYIKRFLEAVKR